VIGVEPALGIRTRAFVNDDRLVLAGAADIAAGKRAAIAILLLRNVSDSADQLVAFVEIGGDVLGEGPPFRCPNSVPFIAYIAVGNSGLAPGLNNFVSVSMFSFLQYFKAGMPFTHCALTP
jgi:hypothetical protein